VIADALLIVSTFTMAAALGGVLIMASDLLL
jgi:hypothetical protein